MPLQTIIYFVVFFALFFLFTGSIYRDNYTRALPLLGVVVLLILFAGLRYYVGNDYPIYMEGFDSSFSKALHHMEPFWQWFRLLLLHLGIQSQGWFLLTATAIVLLSIEAYRRQSYQLAIALLTFVLLYRLYFESFNTVRQVLAQSVALFAYPLLRDRKYWKALIILLLACCFHESAIVLFVLLPICFVRFPRWVMAILLLLSYFLFPYIMKAFLLAIMPLLAVILPLDTSYIVDMKPIEQGTTGITFVLGTLFSFYWLYRQNDLLERDRNLLPYLNSFFLAIIITNSFVTVLQVGYRLMYYFLYSYPILLSNVFVKGKRLDRYLIVLMLFLETFLSIRYLFDVNNSFFSYRSIFFDREAPMKYPSVGRITPEILLCPKEVLPKCLSPNIAAPWHQ